MCVFFIWLRVGRRATSFPGSFSNLNVSEDNHDFKSVYCKCTAGNWEHDLQAPTLWYKYIAKNKSSEIKDKSNLKVTEYLLSNPILHPSSCGVGPVVRSFMRWKPISSLTFARTVWIYSKWPPSCWNVMGLWLKNHWNVTSREVSCVALQLSTTLSPTVTSTLCGLSSTRMASVSTMLLHCHPRQTQTYWADVQFDWESHGRAKRKPKPK